MDIVSFDGVDDRFKKMVVDTEYFIEATDFERLALWERNEESVLSTSKLKWEEISQGCMFQLGKLAGMPVTFQLTWAKLNGHLVAFWESPSMVADHRMVEAFLDKQKKPKTNAMNFHHVFEICR